MDSQQPEQEKNIKNVVIAVVLVIAAVLILLFIVVPQIRDGNSNAINTNTSAETNIVNNANAATNSAREKVASCNEGCLSAGYAGGECKSGGSGVGNVCDDTGTTKLKQILDADIEVLGCDFEAIGAWDECCCFVPPLPN